MGSDGRIEGLAGTEANFSRTDLEPAADAPRRGSRVLNLEFDGDAPEGDISDINHGRLENEGICRGRRRFARLPDEVASRGREGCSQHDADPDGGSHRFLSLFSSRRSSAAQVS